MAIVFYVLLLSLGIATVVVTTIGYTQIDDDPLMNGSAVAYSVLAFALLGSLVSGVVAFFNPAIRWHALRGAVFDLESEI